MAARVSDIDRLRQDGSDVKEVSAWLAAQSEKDRVRFVTIGSVDDGKSTLIGRLLYDAQGLYQDQLDAVRRASLKGSTRGAGSTSEIDFSLFTDGLAAEREQGITLDVAYRYFETARRKFIIADTPGHVQYTRNMATGASTAEVAIILVDARLGVLTQTRRHAQIAALLGIPHVIACVNKMDLVAYDEARFAAIAAELAEIGRVLSIPDLFAIPVSALAGDNVVTGSDAMPWWSGGALLERLETLTVVNDERDAPFRLPVQIVLRPGIGYRGFAGQIASGTIRTGDEVVALPSGKRTRVVGVDIAGHDVGSASAPLSVALRLADEIDVSRGDTLAAAESAPTIATTVEADVVWMSERPLAEDRAYVLKHTTRSVRATLSVLHLRDSETLAPAPAAPLALNDIGRVRVRCRAPIFVDAYRTNRTMGAFILVDPTTNDTVAAGMIAGTTSETASDPNTRTGRDGEGYETSRVTREERHARLGHEGLVVRVVAPSPNAAHLLGYDIERALFDLGITATVIEGAFETAPIEAAEACARGGLVAVVALSDDGATSASVIVDGAAVDPAEPAEIAKRIAARATPL